MMARLVTDRTVVPPREADDDVNVVKPPQSIGEFENPCSPACLSGKLTLELLSSKVVPVSVYLAIRDPTSSNGVADLHSNTQDSNAPRIPTIASTTVHPDAFCSSAEPAEFGGHIFLNLY